ncbi:MAG: hypothetical protein KGL13_08465 [Gammaproteobacteria bacterium]|nr:hypothetical protein [Gammaproteobacteria bacterium]MDE2346487.1 hypothetical protein [Gammaproteobacteria bacterium]
MRAGLLAISLLCLSAPAAQAAAPETWSVSKQAPCMGLTVSWTPTLPDLQQLVGPHWHPAQGPVAGHGILLLFATRCPQSHVGAKATGPFTMGAVIVPVETPADTHGIQQSNGHGWAVVAEVLGPERSPVMQLFKRHGFTVTNAQVRLTLYKDAKQLQPSISIVTKDGHMGVHAEVSGPAKRFDIVSALGGNNPELFSLFTGKESASRQEQSTAITTAGGTTLVSQFQLAPKPGRVMLDRDFTWSFRFSDQPY